MGIYGHSQGGTQTAVMIGHTHRFKAAVVREAHEAELLRREFLASASPDWRRAISESQGGGDAYDREERLRLESESPVYVLDRVKTPTLLLFGAKAVAPTVGRMLFNGLQRFGVPSEFVVYDEGHVFTRPAAVVDSLVRTVAWFDYWVRDLSYTNEAGQRDYDAWKQQHKEASSGGTPAHHIDESGLH
jgi:dipeptidyl aminopeptidase/acylaminoacyl peptidase